MADPHGFLTIRSRATASRRPVDVRIQDWREVYERQDPLQLQEQSSRCMDCGVPFCHSGCPLGNLIPEWNDLTWRQLPKDAIERLHATNNFPEFTGRLCPAPCESACVLGINQPAVTIKQIEVSIINQAYDRGWVEPHPPERLSGKSVAVVGSGPAGLAAAQQLTRAGHTVVVYERDDRIGGLLRYGIPDFKLEKRVLDQRLNQMMAEGTRFRAGVDVGRDVTWPQLRDRFDAIVIATGSTTPRPLAVPGADLDGVHFAMDYLTRANRAVAGDEVADPIDAKGLDVVVIGGGDTGSDCIGTAIRQGARSVTNLAIGRRPGITRSEHEPWPTMPRLFEVSTSHEEGEAHGLDREFLAFTEELIGEDGHVRTLRLAETEYLPDGTRGPRHGTSHDIPADLVLVAMGFVGPELGGVDEQLGLRVTGRGTIARRPDYSTDEEGMFVAGDAGRGQSLIVWAIAEGRAAAAQVDRFLEGDTVLPAPVAANTRALSLR
ncbi:glutamate synthase subunit beta [Pseudoclavibacter caeni]|jgi:glutamate synthase (NADPH/NADH) small chain|uniref:Glutamate synthase subunit beta n=1 Tax=Pseudoclavibacter caeni TaxID=908846 RepID=A0A7C8BRU8_9MICO|nr:glutamate synthase subunit beta [Pseudoclavibacter caeni]KAB1632898.1 glutamate synthase subunit beta [Pseudoclavibacter caeni]NYJ97137.1 glutamate synthase (NADPH/NADH) small chain [Pseudoclavibacter caeni]